MNAEFGMIMVSLCRAPIGRSISATPLAWEASANRTEEALRRCYLHLVPEGTRVFSHYLPYEAAAQWSYWLPEQRRQLPQTWPMTGTRKQAANGDEFELRARLLDLDPLEQRATRQIRVSLWRAGQMIAEEEHTLQENLYFRNEVLLMLGKVGFRDVGVYSGYSGALIISFKGKTSTFFSMEPEARTERYE